jgi:hypothetical protein
MRPVVRPGPAAIQLAAALPAAEKRLEPSDRAFASRGGPRIAPQAGTWARSPTVRGPADPAESDREGGDPSPGARAKTGWRQESGPENCGGEPPRQAIPMKLITP